jgi:hypothetical protein
LYEIHKKNQDFIRILKFYFTVIAFDNKVIQKIEILACEAEPCVLGYGISLPVKITFKPGINQNLNNSKKLS